MTTTIAWYTAYITDASGIKVFKETCTESAVVGTVRSLEIKIAQAKVQPNLFVKHFDIATAKVVADLDMSACPYAADDSLNELSDEDLLAELLA